MSNNPTADALAKQDFVAEAIARATHPTMQSWEGVPGITRHEALRIARIAIAACELWESLHKGSNGDGK